MYKIVAQQISRDRFLCKINHMELIECILILNLQYIIRYGKSILRQQIVDGLTNRWKNIQYIKLINLLTNTELRCTPHEIKVKRCYSRFHLCFGLLPMTVHAWLSYLSQNTS